MLVAYDILYQNPKAGDSMKSISTYLNFNGDTLEAFNFYKSVLGGEFSMVEFFKDMPGGEKMPKEDQEKVLHIGLRLPNGIELMGSDTTSSKPKVTIGDNFSICLMVESREEAERIYNGLSHGGVATMPLADTFWGSYFGMLRDRFGINWMIDYFSK
jgi:PhnB protein